MVERLAVAAATIGGRTTGVRTLTNHHETVAAVLVDASAPRRSRRSPSTSRALGAALRADLLAAARLAWLAIASSGMLMAIGYRGVDGHGQVGIWGPLLFSTPLLAAWYAFERLDSATRAYRQTIEALAMAPEFGGIVPPGHSQRVAALVGRDGRRARRLGARHVSTSRWPRCCTISDRSRSTSPTIPSRADPAVRGRRGHERDAPRDQAARGRRRHRGRRRGRARAAGWRCRCCASRATTTISPRATTSIERRDRDAALGAGLRVRREGADRARACGRRLLGRRFPLSRTPAHLPPCGFPRSRRGPRGFPRRPASRGAAACGSRGT